MVWGGRLAGCYQSAARLSSGSCSCVDSNCCGVTPLAGSCGVTPSHVPPTALLLRGGSAGTLNGSSRHDVWQKSLPGDLPITAVFDYSVSVAVCGPLHAAAGRLWLDRCHHFITVSPPPVLSLTQRCCIHTCLTLRVLCAAGHTPRLTRRLPCFASVQTKPLHSHHPSPFLCLA